MEYPFFDLSKRGRTKAFRFSDGRVQISVRAPDGQIATIYDKDILIYIASLMVEKINAGETPTQTFTFTAHDYMRVTGKSAAWHGWKRRSCWSRRQRRFPNRCAPRACMTGRMPGRRASRAEERRGGKEGG